MLPPFAFGSCRCFVPINGKCCSFYLTICHFLVPWRQDGRKACSCYTFENGFTGRKNWQRASDSCSFNNKHLLVIETIREWEFINKSISERMAVPYNEWYIGLFRNVTTGEWTWINGKPLTIDKWQPLEPETVAYFALISKQYPPGYYGLFHSIKGYIQRGWICEEETGIN